jgi:hypothetical protein
VSKTGFLFNFNAVFFDFSNLSIIDYDDALSIASERYER